MRSKTVAPFDDVARMALVFFWSSNQRCFGARTERAGLGVIRVVGLAVCQWVYGPCVAA
jgi:hypothetical protein